MITGLAHTGVCVPDCEAAVAFYRDVLGLRVLSPPYVMAGDAIRDDMGQLVSDPTMKAAIVGFDDDGDRVLEVIEYLGVAGPDSKPTGCAFWSTALRTWRGSARHGSSTRGVWCSSSSRRASRSVPTLRSGADAAVYTKKLSWRMNHSRRSSSVRSASAPKPSK
jgi:Glyoxalase/Bleomycin resistance protein/Dioxygenase superfamily